MKSTFIITRETLVLAFGTYDLDRNQEKSLSKGTTFGHSSDDVKVFYSSMTMGR